VKVLSTMLAELERRIEEHRPAGGGCDAPLWDWARDSFGGCR
jgi:hypothetical protein